MRRRISSLVIGGLIATAFQLGCAPAIRKADPVAQKPVPASPSLQEKKMLTAAQRELAAMLEEAMKWRSLDKGAIQSRLHVQPEQAVTVEHRRLGRLTVVENPAIHPAEFSFQGDKLVLITLGRPPLLDPYVDSDLFAVLHGEPARLPSPYGKASPLYVYPELGISFTTRYEDSHKIQYIELFQPQSLESYRQTLYAAPPTPAPGSLE